MIAGSIVVASKAPQANERYHHRVPSVDTVDVEEFSAHFRNLRLPMGLNVDDVRISGRSLRLQSDPFSVEAPEAGILEVFVSEASLAAFLDEKAPAGLKRFSVSGRNGKLHVHAVKKVIVDLQATAVCTLRLEQNRKLFVQIETVDVAGAGIKHLIEAQLEKINPVIDVADFPLPATLESVAVEQGGIVLRGRISP